MLNDDDRKKLAFLNHLFLEQGKDISKDEIRWLLDRLRASLSRPDEFDFPDYVGLFNPLKKVAFALRRVLKPNWQRSQDLPEDILSHGVEVFSADAQCEKHGAYLVVRPWIRVHAETPDAMFEKLRKCTVSLFFDEFDLLLNVPIDDYLIAKDGAGMRTVSPVIYPTRDKLVYQAVEIDLKDVMVDITRPLGVFAPRDTHISLTIKGPADMKHEAIRVISGLTSMEYTTIAEGGGVELSIPREISRSGM